MHPPGPSHTHMTYIHVVCVLYFVPNLNYNITSYIDCINLAFVLSLFSTFWPNLLIRVSLFSVWIPSLGMWSCFEVYAILLTNSFRKHIWKSNKCLIGAVHTLIVICNVLGLNFVENTLIERVLLQPFWSLNSNKD